MKAEIQQFNIQHPTGDDLQRVIQFMIDCDIAEFGEADTDADDVADQWEETDLSTDVWIASDTEGQLIGYALLSIEMNNRRYIDLYTHQGRSPKGLADVLIEQMVERFNTHVSSGSSTADCLLTAYANGLNKINCSAYDAHGFEIEKFHYRMQMDFEAEQPAPEWPQGVALSAFTEADERPLFDLIIETFDWMGVPPFTFDVWQKQMFRGGRFDPELFIMLKKDGVLSGAALCYNEEFRLWLKELAISKRLQGTGLGTKLLKQVFCEAQKRAVPTVALGVVSQNPKAYAFYEHAGMTRTREFVQYKRPAG